MKPDSVLQSWVEVAAGSDFPIANLPYGIFDAGRGARAGVAIGDRILDLAAAAQAGLFDGVAPPELFTVRSLNALMAAGREQWTAVRKRLIELLRKDTRALEGIDRDALLVRREAARLCLPFAPGDYVDFYSSLEHATNLGKILRPGGEPLLPNWRWIPIGYHGRSSTIVVDGTPVRRPCGQRKPVTTPAPEFGPTQSLDIELEMGFLTGPGNALGTRIPVASAAEHIFGMVLVNDWSARDIQAWEYQPLGPFLGKSFATSVSPWIVTLDALEPFAVEAPAQDPPPLAYLHDSRRKNYDVTLLIELQTARMRELGIAAAEIARSNFKHMYWTMAQQLAHATVNGTAVRPGDLYASGTISGTDPHSYGSLIELTWRGAHPIALPSGEERAFLEDGDTLTMRGYCERARAVRIGFGSVSATILPAPA